MPEGPESGTGRAEEEYFQALEERFAQLRGRPLLLSTRDVALVDEWWRAGIPLRIVLDAVEAVFRRRRESDPAATRPVLSLSYCAHAVAEAFHEWGEGQLGKSVSPRDKKGEETDEDREAAALLDRTAEGLRAGGDEEARSVAAASIEEIAAGLRSPDSPGLAVAEERLAAIEDRLIAALLEAMSEDGRQALHRQAEERLRPLRPRLTDHAYRASLQSHLREAVREREGLPPLTLYLL